MSPRRAPRSRHAARPFVARCEALEPRVVLTTTSALDPTFGTGGVVLGATSPTDTNLSSVTAVAVQPDGKIVEVGQTGQPSAAANEGLAVRRLNADGSLDTTFGTNGQVTIPNANFADQFSQAPRNVVIAPDGSIVFAAVAQEGTGNSQQSYTSNSVVVRLTPAGQLDPTFGTGGEYVVPMDAGSLTLVAMQADGKVVAAGLNYTSSPSASILRLTTAGAPDTTFNTTGFATTSFVLDTGTTAEEGSVASLAITPGGQILVGGNAGFVNDSALTSTTEASLVEFNADGTLDTSFGTAGKVGLTPAQSGALEALAVQPDGSILLAGNFQGTSYFKYGSSHLQSITLARLTAAGAIDPSFPEVGPLTATGVNPIAYAVSSIALDAAGRITLGGTATIGSPSHNSPNMVPFVARYLSTGAVDTTFGINGLATLNILATYPTGTSVFATPALNAIALTADGRVLAAGTSLTYQAGGGTTFVGAYEGSQAFLARILPIKTVAVANDYDGDGKTDIAGVLGAFGLYAYRPSSGNADVLAPFGPSTVGAAIPAPGDYDGDGRADIAAYFPAYGALVYRPSSGGADVVVPFGIPGAGNSIPAPGDYDGDGRTDPAVYLPALGDLAYRPSSGGADVIVSFGIAGAGQSIPAPGDYDGDGRTDPAVYLPALGAFAYRPSSGGADVITQFGVAGAGGSIPAPGDYDGDGKTDLAVYLPALGDYAYRPSSGGADVIAQFGIPGSGQSIPAPGDYDGDGKTDLAVYLPSIGYYADRPSSGGADVLSQFGASGTMQTVPASSLSASFAVASSGTVMASSVAVHNLALTDDLISPELAQVRRKHKAMT